MQGKQHYQPTLFSRGDLEKYIPKNNRLRKIDKVLDLSHIRELTRPYYSRNQGRPSIDPEVFFRMLIISHLYGLNSDRQLCEDIQVNLAYRWFLRLSLEDKVPDHSSMTKIRDRLGGKIFKKIFEHMVEECKRAGYVKGDKMMTDSSLVEANASINSLEEREDPQPYKYKKNPMYKNQTHKSRTDPESTLVGRIGYRKGLFYKSHYMADVKTRIITDCHVTIGSMHEAIVMQGRVDYQLKRFNFPIQEIVADSGYSGRENFKFLKNRAIKSYIPMRSSCGRKDGILKSEFTYDRAKDCYICPQGETLHLRARYKKTGERVYGIKNNACMTCLIKSECIPQGTARTIRRSNFEEEIERIKRRMSTPYFKSKLRERMWKLEGLFSEAKYRHGLKRAKYRGMWKVQVQTYMTAFVQNLKRLSQSDLKGLTGHIYVHFETKFKIKFVKFLRIFAYEIA